LQIGQLGQEHVTAEFYCIFESLSIDTKERDMQTGAKLGQKIDKNRRMSDMNR